VVGAGYVVKHAVEQHQARRHKVAAHGSRHAGALPERLRRGGGEPMAAPLESIDTDVSPPVAAAPVAALPVDAPPVAAAAVDGPPVAPPPIAPPVAAPPLAARPVAKAHVSVAAAAKSSQASLPASVKTTAPLVSHPRHSGLAAERDLVATARAALLARDFDTAARALERHAHYFPTGQLAEERDSLRVRVAAAQGDRASARTLAAAFTRAHPSSLFLPAVRAAVAE
jgi:hypothetical protein